MEIHYHGIKFEGGGVIVYKSSHDEEEFIEIMEEYERYQLGEDQDGEEPDTFPEWAQYHGYNVEEVSVSWHKVY